MSSCDTINQDYYFSHTSDQLLDRVGRSILRVEPSDLVNVECSSYNPIGKRHELRIAPGVDRPRLTFAGHAKPFTVMYLRTENALVFDADLRPLLADAVVEPIAVDARFGKASRSYVFGNLRLYQAFGDRVDVGRSSFRAFPNDRYYSHMTRAGRGQETPGTLPKVGGEEITFENSARYVEEKFASSSLKVFVPERLHLVGKAPPPAFDLDNWMTFFRADVVEALRRSHCPGLWFPGPAIPVTVS